MGEATLGELALNHPEDPSTIANTDGRVEDVRVLRSHSVLDEAAVDAVTQWVYEPLMLNDQAQPFVLTVTVSFSLADRPSRR